MAALLKEKYSINGGALTAPWLKGRSAFVNNQTRMKGTELISAKMWDGTKKQLMGYVQSFNPIWTWIMSKAFPGKDCLISADNLPVRCEDLRLQKQAC